MDPDTLAAFDDFRKSLGLVDDRTILDPIPSPRSFEDLGRRAQERVQRLTGDAKQPEETGWFGEVGRGALEGFASGVQGISVMAKRLENALGFDTDDVDDSMLYKLGERIYNYVDENFAHEDPDDRGFWSDTLPNAFGSMIGIMANPVGAPFVSVGGGFREAKAAGLSQEEAVKAAATIENTVAGAIELLPLGKAVGRARAAREIVRLRKAGVEITEEVATQVAKRFGAKAEEGLLRAGLKGGGEEAVQEVVQTALENISAGRTYDPDRPVLGGTGEAGAAGGIVGFMTNVAFGAAGIKLRGRVSPGQAAEIAATLPPEQAKVFMESAIETTEEIADSQEEREVLPGGPEAEAVVGADEVEGAGAQAEGAVGEEAVVAAQEEAAPVAEETAPPPPPAEADPVESAEAGKQEPLLITKAGIARVRAAYEKKQLSTLPGTTFQKLMDLATEVRDENGQNLVDKADQIAGVATRSLGEGKPMRLAPEEKAALAIRQGELLNEIDRHERLRTEYLESGNDVESEIELQTQKELHESLDKVQVALGASGSLSGLDLVAMQMAIDAETFDLVSVQRRARDLRGEDLDTGIFTDKGGSKARTERAANRHQKAHVDLEAEQRKAAHNEAKGAIASLKNKKPTESRASILQKIQQMREEGTLDPSNRKASVLVGKLAGVYVTQNGMTDVGQVVDAVGKDVAEFGKDDITTSLGGRHPANIAHAKTEAQETLADLKKQANSLSRINDILNGVERTTKATKSQMSKKAKIFGDRLVELRFHAQKAANDDVALGKIHNRITELTALMDKGIFDVPVKGRREVNPAVAEARQKLADIAREMNIRARAESLYEQINTGEFIEPVKNERELPPGLRDAMIELSLAKQAVRESIALSEKFRITRVPLEILRSIRAILATADVSYAMRQGMILGASHPLVATQTFGRAFTSMFSKKRAEYWDQFIRENPNHNERIRSGLFIATLEAGGVNQREELFMQTFLRRIPGVSHIMAASERNMVTGLNLLRVAAFDGFLKTHENATDAEKRQFAGWINAASGRGDLGKFEHASRGLAEVFFSPRFLTSRFQTMGKTVNAALNPKADMSPAVRAAILKDAASFAAFGSMVLGMAALAGADVGDDPRESDFGKIIVGNTRIDIWASHVQVFRLLAGMAMQGTDRLGLTEPKTFSSTALDQLQRFTQYKMNPAILAPLEILSGENVIGQETTLSETAIRNAVPLAGAGIYEAAKREDGNESLLLSPMELLGVGVQTYDNALKGSKIKRMLEEADYRPANPVYKDRNEWVKKDVGLKRELNETFQALLAADMARNYRRLSVMDQKRKKAFIQKLAKRARTRTLRTIPRQPR